MGRDRQTLQKGVPVGKLQQQRREAALQKQREARKHAQEALRAPLPELSQDATAEHMEVSDAGEAAHSENHSISSSFADAQLMHSEQLVDTPHDLFQGQWFVLPRPTGTRCLLVATNGMTHARDAAGSKLETFRSILPNGGAQSSSSSSPNSYHGSGKDRPCIIDAVRLQSGEYVALDCMCWNGHPMYYCDTEFRLFWLHSQFADIPGNQFHAQRRISPVWYETATADTSNALLNGAATPYRIDGIVFILREAHYETGISPLSLFCQPSQNMCYGAE